MLLNLFGLWQQLVVGGSSASGSKRVYIERDGQILIFEKPAHAAAYISAEKAAEVPADVPKKSLPKRLQAKVASIKQPEVIQLDILALLAVKFAVPEWQTAVQQHDYEALYQLHQHLLMLQDEEDVELLLLAA